MLLSQNSARSLTMTGMIGLSLSCLITTGATPSANVLVAEVPRPPKVLIHCLRRGSDMAFRLRWEYPFVGSSRDVHVFRICRRIEGGDYSVYTSIPRNGAEKNTTVYRQTATTYEYSYTDGDVQPGITYAYKVVARDPAGNEGSNEVRIRAEAAAARVAGPGNVLVVVNQGSPESIEIGEYYQRQRAIPERNIVRLSYRGNPEIVGFKDFEKQIKGPLGDYLVSRGLKEKILYIVLTYGLPYKIYVRGGRAADSVDAYLTDLFDEYKEDPNLEMSPGAARYRNPYYLAGSHFSRANGNKGYLVTRLDGPLAQPGDAHYNRDTLHADDRLQYLKNMVDYALSADQDAARLSGKGYFDRRYKEPWRLPTGKGDLYISGAYDCCRTLGFEAVLDTNPQLFGTKPTKAGGENPLRCNDALWYAGWYSHLYQDVFEWQKGAVGFHIESWTARYLRSQLKSPGRSDWLWVPGMIRAGVTATMGPVHEPGLGGVPQIDWFFRYFFHGFSFVEAAYMANYSSSGRMVMIGDPLYCPLRGRELERIPPTITIASPGSGQTIHGVNVLVEGTVNDPSISMLDDAHPIRDQQFRFSRSIGTSERSEADLPIIVRATDTCGNRTSKTVMVHWVNNPPRLEPIQPMKIREGDTLTLELTARDPNNDEVTYSAATNGGLPRGVSFDRKTGRFRWKPDFEQAGTYEFVFQATDGFASDSKQASITVQQAGSHAPKFLIASRKLRGKVGGGVYLDLKAEDADGDALTFSSINPLPTGAILVQSPPKYAALFWKPRPDQVGLHKITFKVSDEKGDEDTVVVEVEVLPSDIEEKR